jgi:hypothetical protein
VPEAPYNLPRRKWFEVGVGGYAIELHDDFDVCVGDLLLQVARKLGAGHCQAACHKDSQHCHAQNRKKNRGGRGLLHPAPNGTIGIRLLLAIRGIVIDGS